jgi:phosphatidylglycerophosphatase C
MSTGDERPLVAAFDVDGTLTVRDCVRPFLQQIGGVHGLVVAFARRPLASVWAAVRRDRDRLKEIFVGGVLRGRAVTVVNSMGEAFAAKISGAWLRSDTLARLRWHQQRGHRVVLVSASLAPYLHPLGRFLGVDAVLCAEPRRAGDVYADGLEGANCRRAEKVRRLDMWLHDVGAADAFVWAYGDSAGDAELLARADRAVWARGVVLTPSPSEETE